MKKIILIIVVLAAVVLLVLWKVSQDNVRQESTSVETARALDRLAAPTPEEKPLTPEQQEAIQGLSAPQTQKSEAQMKQEAEALRLLEGK